jgi:iron complex outermembrane receptor protein
MRTICGAERDLMSWMSTKRDLRNGTPSSGAVRCRQAAIIVAPALLCFALSSQAAAPSRELADMSLEELGNVRVMSVSKKVEPLADAAASVFVISAQDIRRSGAVSLPEALRLAPNLQVAQPSAYGYAISARGFNGSNSSAPNKLLVLIDGRSVYSPLFAGVFWDVQDLMLEDIERIEVISGPGGTLWGLNAVNGVINIITRNAADTQGALLVAGADNRESNAAVRFGGTIGDDGHYRVYSKYLDRRHSSSEAHVPIDDAGHKAQVGFRADWGDADSRWSVHGAAYRGAEGQPAPGSVATGAPIALGDIQLSGANLTARWDRQLDSGSGLSLQAYYDRTERDVVPTFAEELDIFDLQFQHSLRPIGRHSAVWGANYRYSRDRVDNSVHFAFLPAEVNQKWPSLFVQDDIALRENLRLIVGARLERNDYTGSEFLPNARLAWTLSSEHMLWAAASRAVRAPSRLDRDAYVPGIPPFLLDGGRSVRSEVAKVYELGYRGQSGAKLSYSATIFHSDYDWLRTQEIAPSGTFLTFANGMQGYATGLETWGKYQLAPNWQISAGYTALRERLSLKPGSNDVAAPLAAGNDPSHSWQVRSSWDIGSTRTFDVGVRHVAALDRHSVPDYTAVDARLGWNLRPNLELSITARNLTGDHAEYGPLTTRAEFGRSVFLKLAWEMR